MDNPKEENKTNEKTNHITDQKKENNISYFKIFLAV